MTAIFQFVSRILYLLVTLALLTLAFGFIAYAAWSVYRAVSGQDPLLSSMLHAVGLVIIGLAVADVGKFLQEEELGSERQLETTFEVRRTLIKFLTIIIIAASLETIVFLFEAGRESAELLLYPAALLIAVSVLIASFALFQRLIASAEHAYRADLSKEDAPLNPEKEALTREAEEEEAEA